MLFSTSSSTSFRSSARVLGIIMAASTAVLFLVAPGSTTNVVTALPEYSSRIPNGNKVPHPGPQGGTWAGVGHLKAAGGGPRNPFGLDFAQAGYQWTTTLCGSDSDGDGRSNGEELGDPRCVWIADADEEPEGPALSHPGIVDEPKTLEEIELLQGSCDDYVAPEDEVMLDFVFTQPSVMNEEQTHYICEQKLVDVSQLNGVYHKIKEGVLLDPTSNVLHHMFAYVCPAGTQSIDGDRVGQGQYACSGNESACRRVAGWAIGPQIDRCSPPTVGQRLDFSNVEGGQVVVKIEAHYDNTSGRPQQDQSGMRIHMTPTLRPLDSSTVSLGMTVADNNFAIPPGEAEYPLVNICPTTIMDRLEHPIYVYEFYPHMHLFGRTMVTEHYRCGVKIGELGRIDAYEFDNQQAYRLPHPVKVLPGDAFVTTCTYDSTTNSVTGETIFGGEETVDEMCINFMNVYPDPRTEDVPTFLQICTTVTDGVRNPVELGLPEIASTISLATGDAALTTVTPNFDTDPALNIGLCCSADNEVACEEMYLAELGVACGVDADCVGDLVCGNGLCVEPTVIDGEDDEELETSTNGGSSSATSLFSSDLIVETMLFWFVALVVVAV